MNNCHACGLSKALCGHPDRGWVSGPLRRAVLRFLFGFLLGDLWELLLQLQDVSWTGLAPGLGPVFVQLMPEVEWVWVRKIVTLILLVLLL